MGLGISLGGLANGYAGFQKGQEEADSQAQVVKDRSYLERVRADDIEARGRAKQLRTDVANIPDSVTTETPQSLPPQDDGSDPTLTPIKTTRVTTMDERLRSSAEAHKRSGDMEGYLTQVGAADKIAFDRSAKTANEIIAGSNNQSAFQIATAAKAAFDADPFPGKITKITDNGRGGTDVTAVNKDTGQSTTKTYVDAAAMRDGIMAHYSPASYEIRVKNREAEATKIREEQAKVHTLAPGAQLANGVGRLLANNPNMTAADAKLAGLEFGLGARPKGVDQNKLLDDAWDRSNSGDAKLPAEQLVTGRRLTEQLVGNSVGKIKPSLAAEIAYKVTKDPQLVQPSIDNATGDIVGAYKHPTLGEFKIDDSAASARSPGDFKPEQLKVMANNYVSRLPSNERAELVGAAFDPTKMANFTASVYASIDDAAEQRRKNNPNITAEQTQAWSMQTKLDSQKTIQKKLDLIGMYADRPKAEVAKSSGGLGIGGRASVNQAAANSPAPIPGGNAGGSSAMMRQSGFGTQQANQQKRMQEQAEASAEMKKNAPIQAQQLLDGKDDAALYAFQATPAFDVLPIALKTAIYNRVNGR